MMHSLFTRQMIPHLNSVSRNEKFLYYFKTMKHKTKLKGRSVI